MDVAVAWILIWQTWTGNATASQGFHDRPSCERARQQIENRLSGGKAFCTPWYRQAPDQDEVSE